MTKDLRQEFLKASAVELHPRGVVSEATRTWTQVQACVAFSSVGLLSGRLSESQLRHVSSGNPRQVSLMSPCREEGRVGM